MIPIALAKEPSDFDTKVRKPGLSAIDELVGRQPRIKRRGPPRTKVASTKSKIPPDKFPPFWRKAIDDMMDAYQQRCAYLAMYIHRATGAPTVDHVLPKSYAWNRVYEWDNYRLCAGIINASKGALRTLVDPVSIKPDWFQLNLNTMNVERGASKGASLAQRNQIDATLPVLNHRLCVAERTEYVQSYKDGPDGGGISLERLQKHAPFIASELRRQGRLVRGDV